MSLLNAQQQTIEIKLYYKEIQTDSGYSKIQIIYNNDEAQTELKEQKEQENAGKKIDESDKVRCLTTKWKTLNWQEQNDITKRSSFYNMEQGHQDVDIWQFRDLRLKQCLKEWDLKDDGGAAVPLAPNMLDQLPSEVVLALLSKYDEAINVSSDDKKK